MNIDDINVFCVAVSVGSLAAAARRLGITAMMASRRLAALETALGVRLLHRTTRALSLTSEGETFLPFALAIVENGDEALARMRSDTRGAAGLLRVSVPVAFGLRFVAPVVPGLLARHPELRIALDLTDALPNLVATGTDLAIRIAKLRDSSLIAQKLADNPRLLVASPGYLDTQGTPASLEALAVHDCLPLDGVTHWTFSGEKSDRHVRVNARFSSSSIAACLSVCLAGGGIALLSHWNVSDDLASGRLVRIDLPDARPETLNIWAVYPTARLVLPKVRVFIAALRQALAEGGVAPLKG
ncbi:LysR family transcriptional regulator [Rhizobium sp. GN54]|uniref:LysR family transcriptional regulator n=1 Tax=Rhizobium sp. GN54 TaxID=2898150 RepID=UPI001E48EAA9|nr:LysR family transcriptional regulator [Rhizobium sp. GN54]MCD2184723.1 LysR family transcriptional regulator [Rhizobium sp. GN54]